MQYLSDPHTPQLSDDGGEGGSSLTALETAVLNKLAEGPGKALELLRAQVASATVIDRKMTGVGFYTTLSVASDVPSIPQVGRGPFGDVSAIIDGLPHGAGFLVWFDDGRISQLEGFTYTDNWPDHVAGFELKYNGLERDLRGIDPPRWKKL